MKALKSVAGYWLKKIGMNRGTPRLWFETAKVRSVGFEPGCRFDVVHIEDGIKLEVRTEGRYKVSSKVRNGRITPVIDLNSRVVLGPLLDHQVVRVIIRCDGIFVLPIASEKAKRERIERLQSKLIEGTVLSSASIAHGVGVMANAAHAGFSDAGLPLELRVLCEIDDGYTEQSLTSNPVSPGSIPLCAPIQELVQDDWLLGCLPKVELLEMGLPCSGASRAGKSKRGLGMMEDHPEVGHLVHAALVLIQRLQPAAVVLENVEGYRDSASAQILRSQLRDMGYVVREHVLRARDFGCLENRVRWALVATTDGLPPLADIPAPEQTEPGVLGDHLEPVALDSSRWSAMDYLKVKEERDRAAGKGFAMQLVDADSRCVPTIRKSYNKGGSTDPYVKHPVVPGLMRKFTPKEHASIKGVPAELIAGMSETAGHEVLGQGVAYAPFRALFAELGRAFRRLLVGEANWSSSCESLGRLARSVG